eukprot:5137118-Prymnesium_polylepis.1
MMMISLFGLSLGPQTSAIPHPPHAPTMPHNAHTTRHKPTYTRMPTPPATRHTAAARERAPPAAHPGRAAA